MAKLQHPRPVMDHRSLPAGAATGAVGEDIVTLFDPLVDLVVSRLSEQKETCGIVLLGGLGARRFIDEYSDLDIAIFVDTDVSYLPPFSFIIHFGGRDVEFNVTQHVLGDQTGPWEAERHVAYQHGTIVFSDRQEVRNEPWTRKHDENEPLSVSVECVGALVCWITRPWKVLVR